MGDVSPDAIAALPAGTAHEALADIAARGRAVQVDSIKTRVESA
jgi:hypothetical protein